MKGTNKIMKLCISSGDKRCDGSRLVLLRIDAQSFTEQGLKFEVLLNNLKVIEETLFCDEFWRNWLLFSWLSYFRKTEFNIENCI